MIMEVLLTFCIFNNPLICPLSWSSVGVAESYCPGHKMIYGESGQCLKSPGIFFTGDQQYKAFNSLLSRGVTQSPSHFLLGLLLGIVFSFQSEWKPLDNIYCGN